jgi:hypothetical protein
MAVEPKAMGVELPEQLLAMTAQLAEQEVAAKAREGHAVAAKARASEPVAMTRLAETMAMSAWLVELMAVGGVAGDTDRRWRRAW